MYKALEASIRSSEKHAEISDFAYRVWAQGLAVSDIVGRLTANPRKFQAEAIPLLDYDEPKLLAAFNELKASKLVHFYEVEGKPYMVFHDHEECNKGTKNLKYQLRSKVPPPPPSLCFCVTYTKEEENQVTADQSADQSAVASAAVHVHVLNSVPSESKGDSKGDFDGQQEIRPAIRHLYTRAKEAKMAGRKETILSYLDAWAARSDAGKVEQYLMDPWSKGKTVIEFQNHFFPCEAPSRGVGSINDVMDDWVKQQRAKA